jgi:hypothetical protein
MSKHLWYECLWTIQHKREGKVIWEEREKKNILVDDGEKAIGDTFFRNRASLYFASDNFYVGLYHGSVIETTILPTVPNEPSGNGYSRLVLERSDVGFITMELDEGDYRWVSKDLELDAVGGDIGPLSGAFLCTSSDNSGVLVGAIAFGVERTLKAGDKISFQMRVKLK